MNRYSAQRSRTNSVLLLTSCLAFVTFGLGFWATDQWRHTSEEAAETRGEEAVALLAEALQRDMNGGQTSVLLPITQPMAATGPLYDLADEFARGFARFPYLESFFVSRRTEDGFATYVFSRSDRRPPWDHAEDSDESYPVVISQGPASLRSLVAQAQEDAHRQLQFTVHEFSVAGFPYQAFSRLYYERGPASARLSGVVGFAVNLDWARRHYFDDFIRQMQSIIGDRTIGVRIVDDAGAVVASVGPPMASAPKHVRRFPLLFLDRMLVPDLNSPDRPDWTVQVDSTNQAALSAARFGASWVLALLALATALSFVALVLTVRATATTARIVAAQAEFVSAVTHEMKTPLALFRLASDTLATGRYDSEKTIPDYGRLLAAEAGRLTRLIDNVLCYARLDNTASRYHFERVDVVELIEECVNRWQPELRSAGLEVRTDLPPDGADIRVDPSAIQQVFDNLIDNAARHAASGRVLRVTVERGPGSVAVVFADAGPGIPADDLARIFEKFYRGANAGHRGSGLGLAIVRHIVEDHGGTIAVQSVAGQGATFRVAFPAWEDDDDRRPV